MVLQSSPLPLFSPRRFCAGLLSLLLAMEANVPAQTFEREIAGVQVEKEGRFLAFPFFGGLDRFLPQFVDIDGDDDVDLFLLKAHVNEEGSRIEGRLTLFENTGTPTNHRFQFRTNEFAGVDVQSWFYFVDIDGDRDFDLFYANGDAGLAWQRNTGNINSPRFQLETIEVLDPSGEKIVSEFLSIPTFVDIDVDGDIDFFTGLSNGYIAFYENVGTPLAPMFQLATGQWQDLLILSGGFQNHSTFPGRIPRHGANGIAFTDLDADGDQDFFYGDLFHPSVYHLKNLGTPEQAEVPTITDTLFPASDPVITAGLNVPRFADIDGDNDMDLFVSSQLENQNHFLYLLNFGAPESPSWLPITSSFVTMIDEGSDSAPALADIDADGDVDLFIGKTGGRLSYFENTGSASDPAFHWRTDDFQQLRPGGLSITPAFGDLDGDGDLDLVVGSFLGRLTFFENQGTRSDPSFVIVTSLFGDIDVGIASAPHLADFDHDGDLDLFIGESTEGIVSILENTGNAQSANFQFSREVRLAADISDSKPFAFDWNEDGRIDLFAGLRNGRILYYEGTATPGTFVLRDLNFGDIRAAQSSAPVVFDLDQDGSPDFLVGEAAGGLSFFRGQPRTAVNSSARRVPDSFSLAFFPNPFFSALRVTIAVDQQEASEPPRLRVYDLLGVEVANLEVVSAGTGRWQTSWQPGAGQANGVYFLRVTAGRQNLVRKVIRMR